MEMTGEVRIPASREVVWAALNNPAILRTCIPGCEELNALSDTEMKAVVAIRVGPISTRFNCAVTLSELDPPHGYRIAGEGQGGVAGHARGGAEVKLTADGTDTLLSYTFSAQVGGKLAQLGSRMIDATSKTIASVFFKNLARQIDAHQQGEAATSPALAASGEKPQAMAPAAPTAPAVRTPARSAGIEPARTGRSIAVAALAIALLAAVLAWRALTGPVVPGGIMPTTTAEFNTAVQLLIVLAIGYLLGRTQTHR